MVQPHDPTDTSTRNPTSKPRPDPAQKGRDPSNADAVLNAIEFGPYRPRGADSGGTLGVERMPKAARATRNKTTQKASEEARAKPAIQETRSEPIPDTVRERFIQIGSNFFFPDGAEAFTDHGNRVTTRSENAIVIQSMVAIAQARAASAITVTGSDFFKKEAWFAASLVGLEVKGFEPSALEQERLVRALARRRTEEREEHPSTPNPSSRREGESGAQSRQAASPTELPERSPKQGEFIVGRLVDHGPAPYQHQPTQQMSYYVHIETDRGDREIWGVDLERAFRQSLSTPGVGDEVGVRSIGRDPVTVRAPQYDAAGREVGREALETHRNQWIVERKDFLDGRLKMADLFRDPAVSASEGVRQHPELEGSYLQLQIARAGAEERIVPREPREQFVEHLRTHLAKTIEYGQALQPVHMKARSELASEPEKAQDRDRAPTR